MEEVKEFFDTLNARIKVPIFGSIALAFMVINWRAIFYVIFSDIAVEDRYAYFDGHTNWLTLIVLPLIIGTVLAWISPWISYFATRWTIEPKKRLVKFQNETEHEILEEKIRYEQIRHKLLEVKVENEELVQTLPDVDESRNGVSELKTLRTNNQKDVIQFLRKKIERIEGNIERHHHSGNAKAKAKNEADLMELETLLLRAKSGETIDMDLI